MEAEAQARNERYLRSATFPGQLQAVGVEAADAHWREVVDSTATETGIALGFVVVEDGSDVGAAGSGNSGGGGGGGEPSASQGGVAGFAERIRILRGGGVPPRGRSQASLTTAVAPE